MRLWLKILCLTFFIDWVVTTLAAQARLSAMRTRGTREVNALVAMEIHKPTSEQSTRVMIGWWWVYCRLFLSAYFQQF